MVLVLLSSSLFSVGDRFRISSNRDTQIILCTDNSCNCFYDPVRKSLSGNVDSRERGHGRGGEIINREVATEIVEPSQAVQIAGTSVGIDDGFCGCNKASVRKLCQQDFLGPNALNLSDLVTPTCEHQFSRVLTERRNLFGSQNKKRHVL